MQVGVVGDHRAFSFLILIQSDQLSLLSMQMFGLRAEGATPTLHCHSRREAASGTLLALALSRYGRTHCLNLYALFSLPLLTGDNYPVQFIPSTMAGAAASGLSPLQLQVCTMTGSARDARQAQGTHRKA